MPPESLLEELNHEEPAGISQTEGDGGGGGVGGAGWRQAEKDKDKVGRENAK